ncbi:AAA family ATPase [uncultured Fibrella sp.]|uniref:AAA family ATPase n=1 Tax=uncultured Fibrella sp. TaxID=1284596 RepID=UPI0035C99879
MRNIIGQAVSGSDFFDRPQVIKRIRRAIRNGNQVYLSAPRRVGKTSIMHHLSDNPEPGEHYVYAITQSVDSLDGFYKELAKQVIGSDAFGRLGRTGKTIKNGFTDLLQRISLKVNVPMVGELSLDKGTQTSIQTDFTTLLEELDLEGGKLIILVDEFTETLDNILIKHGKQEAKRFLQSFRELMHNRKLTGHVQFLLTGSIGLQPLVKKLEATDLINQLNIIDVPALTEDEACHLFRQLVDQEDVTIDDETVRYILRKIDWLMPFHVQLLALEVIDVHESAGSPIDQRKADKAFDQVFHQRNKIYFEQYYDRLKKRLELGPEYQFVHELLNRAANVPTLDKAIVHDLAVKHAFADQYKATLESLLYDGYLHETADGSAYRFNSSILKTWWKKYVG